MRFCLLFLCLLTVAHMSLSAVMNRKMDGQDRRRCVPLKEIPMCAQMRYQIGAFPNFKQQFSPDEANNELVDFTQLLNSKCSNALIYLLCSVYAPYCYNTTEKNVVRTKALPPCRSLCEYVSEGCANVVREQGHIWPPGPHLNCSNYPTSGLCFGPSDPSTLPVIDIITEVPKMCEAQANKISSTSADITLLSRNNSTSNVSMAIACSPPALSQTRKDDHTVTLTALQANTEYNCTVLHYKPARSESCRLEFTTKTRLEIQLINDTPDVQNRMIQLDFQTNRPASTIECQLQQPSTSADHKVDCSSGTIQFAQLSPGFYTIRIVAENGRSDRGTLRVRVRVPESSDHCAVNLINQQWMQEGANVTMWFETLGPVKNVKCEANNMAKTCTSPYFVTLSSGNQKIRLLPKGPKCNKKSPRTISITVRQ